MLEDYDLFIRLYMRENVKTICWRNIFNNDDDDTRERHTHSTLGTVQMNFLILYHYRDDYEEHFHDQLSIAQKIFKIFKPVIHTRICNYEILITICHTEHGKILWWRKKKCENFLQHVDH